MLGPRTKLLVIAAIAVTIIAGLAVLGFVTRQSPVTTKPNQVTTEEREQEKEQEQSGSEPQHEEAIEKHDSIYIENFEVLFTKFSDAQALFINENVMNYAYETRQEKKVYIDDNYISELSPDRYGFSIRNEAGEDLFYVIATKMPDDVVKVEIFP
ncbi:MAG: hypothetical protein ACREGJ_04125 [Candidatus Saccharimonadales bacterium]